MYTVELFSIEILFYLNKWMHTFNLVTLMSEHNKTCCPEPFSVPYIFKISSK